MKHPYTPTERRWKPALTHCRKIITPAVEAVAECEAQAMYSLDEWDGLIAWAQRARALQLRRLAHLRSVQASLRSFDSTFSRARTEADLQRAVSH